MKQKLLRIFEVIIDLWNQASKQLDGVDNKPNVKRFGAEARRVGRLEILQDFRTAALDAIGDYRKNVLPELQQEHRELVKRGLGDLAVGNRPGTGANAQRQQKTQNLGAITTENAVQIAADADRRYENAEISASERLELKSTVLLVKIEDYMAQAKDGMAALVRQLTLANAQRIREQESSEAILGRVRDYVYGAEHGDTFPYKSWSVDRTTLRVVLNARRDDHAKLALEQLGRIDGLLLDRAFGPEPGDNPELDHTQQMIEKIIDGDDNVKPGFVRMLKPPGLVMEIEESQEANYTRAGWTRLNPTSTAREQSKDAQEWFEYVQRYLERRKEDPEFAAHEPRDLDPDDPLAAVLAA